MRPRKVESGNSLLDLPNVQESDLLRMLRREMFIAVVPFVILATGSFIATHQLPEGKAFVLESRGIGIFYDIISSLVIIALFSFMYMFPSLWVRRWLSIVYRILIFLIFTASLCWFEAEKFIAVVQTSDSFVFVRRVPFGSVTVRFRDVGAISTRKTGAVQILGVMPRGSMGRPIDILTCQRVWNDDGGTLQVMDELAMALTKARDESHKGVAATSPPR